MGRALAVCFEQLRSATNDMYLPQAYQGMNPPECGLDVLASGEAGPFVIRAAKIVGLRTDKPSKTIRFSFAGRGPEVAVSVGTEMHFGGERVTALQYAKRVLERGDEIDLVVSPAMDVPVLAFWIRIVCEDTPRPGQQYRLKEPGLFAMRTKAGEKAERWTARQLVQAGHTFPAHMLISPGYFRIVFAGKRDRKPDLVCSDCGLRFEVKKRNRDRRFRVSHSTARPFSTENRVSDWHAFVFPDLSIKYVANARILALLETQRFEPGHDQYDGWADLDAADVFATEDAPSCQPV